MKERKSPKRDELPAELKVFLRTQEYACLLHAMGRGTVVVVKAPAEAVSTLGGPIQLRVTHKLHSNPTAPVIRTVLGWSDRPGSQLLFESFTDVRDPQQRENFRQLARQPALSVLGYDEHLKLVARKRVSNLQQREIGQIADTADKLLWFIPTDTYDFETAKARVLEKHPLNV